MPDERIDVQINVADAEARNVAITGYGARGMQIEAALADVLDVSS